MTGVVLAGLACLAVAIAGGLLARAELTRPPTAAERSDAAAKAVALRWQDWPAGRIFPPALSYTTSLLTTEHARLIGIAPGKNCAVALDAALAAAARRDGCRAALRATYADELQGALFTTGVLAFGDPGRAVAFARAVRASQGASGRAPGLPGPGLRAFALPGTAAARFNDAARQAATVRQAGPYVLLTVAGYADGRPAAATAERRPSAFAPGAQLAAEILAPLTRPVTVNCMSQEWSC